ncbi:S8 family serine peptidase [candidate division KSB1 bacterium]|nr:S8 family serine peptidase [candidate division KSB1 bacterium]
MTGALIRRLILKLTWWGLIATTVSYCQSPNDQKYNQIIIKFKENLSQKTISSLSSQLNPSTIKPLPLINAQLWNIASPVEEAINYLQSRGHIEYAEPDYILSLYNIYPKDPSFEKLWGLHNWGQNTGTEDADIDAPEAWEITTGNKEILIGVIDTGIDYNHRDLEANIWYNPDEIIDGIDNDKNGYIDDIRGWDFANNDNIPFDDRGHGTHCAGIMGAVGNNDIGVTGLAWNVKLMALKIFDENGKATISSAIKALEYAVDKGARISNNSWGGYFYSNALEDAIKAAKEANHLFVVAAGNESKDNDGSTPSYPASYDLDNIISVAATDRYDKKSSFSNFGPISVDLAAPGELILSTFPGNQYTLYSGTSMAAPYVAATAGLFLSLDPSLSYIRIKNHIVNNVDPLPSLKNKCLAAGRLNVFKALSSLNKTFFSAIPTSISFGEVVVGDSKKIRLDLFNSSSSVAVVTLRSSHSSFVPEEETLHILPENCAHVDIRFTPQTEKKLQETIKCIFNGTQMIKVLVEGFGYDNPFVKVNTDFIPLFFGNVEWADYDNDHDFDLLVTGCKSNMQFEAKLYENIGNDRFKPLPQYFPAVIGGRAEWNDFNNDNEPDLLLSGMNENNQHILKLFLNIDKSFSEHESICQNPYHNGCASGVDYDSDGDLDIFHSGESVSGEIISTIYRNNGNGVFTAIDLDFDAAFQSISWGDYNNDGYIDLLATGDSGTKAAKTCIYQNMRNGQFKTIPVVLPQLTSGYVEWGDYNNDGFLDILLSGESDRKIITELYQNFSGDTFTRVYTGIEGVASGVATGGDYDADGDLDILLTGYNQAYEYTTSIYRNDGNHRFLKINSKLQNIVNGDATWGDYDNDGDLDIAMSGYNGSQLFSLLYKNQISEKRKRPLPPTTLPVKDPKADEVIMLQWHNNEFGMTYNLRVGTTPGGTDVISPLADEKGNRKTSGPGNAGTAGYKKLKNLKAGTTYYWSVQAIDQTFNGSEFSAEESFTPQTVMASVHYKFPMKGWYLISVTVRAASMCVQDLFPTAQPFAYYYDPSLNFYLHTDTLSVNRAYWIQIQHPGEITIQGVPVTQYTIDLKKGWNMLGAVYKNINFNHIKTTPPSSLAMPATLWDNDNHSFVSGYHMHANQGCWVLAKRNCQVKISADSSVVPLSKMMVLSEDVLPPLPPGFRFDQNREKSDHKLSAVQNYPNPFNNKTTIQFTLPKATRTRIEIYNLRGEKIQILANHFMASGMHEMVWDGKTLTGQPAPSGVYLIQISADEVKRTKKAILTR